MTDDDLMRDLAEIYPDTDDRVAGAARPPVRRRPAGRHPRHRVPRRRQPGRSVAARRDRSRARPRRVQPRGPRRGAAASLRSDQPADPARRDATRPRRARVRRLLRRPPARLRRPARLAAVDRVPQHRAAPPAGDRLRPHGDATPRSRSWPATRKPSAPSAARARTIRCRWSSPAIASCVPTAARAATAAAWKRSACCSRWRRHEHAADDSTRRRAQSPRRRARDARARLRRHRARVASWRCRSSRTTRADAAARVARRRAHPELARRSTSSGASPTTSDAGRSRRPGSAIPACRPATS